jgi:hypothetical protein
MPLVCQPISIEISTYHTESTHREFDFERGTKRQVIGYRVSKGFVLVMRSRLHKGKEFVAPRVLYETASDCQTHLDRATMTVTHIRRRSESGQVP